METWTDSELACAARQGDKAAFGVLASRYHAMVENLAYRTIRHAELARDLAQESLLQAYLSLDSLRSDDRFRSWLYGITLNVCRCFLRSQHTNPLSLESLLGGIHRDDGTTPEEIAERLELRQIVMNAVEHLSPANRAAVLLFYYEGFSLQEAADLLGITVTALKGRLHKAREQLRVRLLPDYESREEKMMTDMIPVKIVDVIRREVNVEGGKPYTAYQVVLFDEASHRALIIWTGKPEGWGVYLEMVDIPAQRPRTQQFVERLLNAAGAKVEAVHINALKDDVYYATVYLTARDSTHEIDARPSDALALAARMKAPVYVSVEVMDQQAIPVPEKAMPMRGGLAEIEQWVKEENQIRQEHETHIRSKPAERRQQDQEAEKQAILHKVFGI